MKGLALALGLLGTAAHAAVPDPGEGVPVSAAALMRLGEAELDALFRRSEPGPIPDGEANGVASSDPGTGWGEFTREFFGGLWTGKVFDRAGASLRNRTAIGTTADAKVYPGESRLDGRPAIILDYSQSGVLLARGVRDEIRMVTPGLYLGIAYLRFPPLVGKHEKWLYFALQFEPAPPAPAGR